jgi:ParB-like chromosome segregation protein Spo0J
MNRLQHMTTPELVDRFTRVTLGQYEALLDDDRAKFKRLFGEMRRVLEELKARPGDQRRALLPLYDHPNVQVRLKAAKNTLAVTPDAALELLRAIAESGMHPQAGEAGMSLWNLENGTFKPT